MKKENPHKEMAELYYNLYVGCIKYKTEKKTKKINFDQYYTEFKNFTNKYFESKESKN